MGEVTQKLYEKMQKRNVTSLEEMAVNEPGCSQVDFSGSSGLYIKMDKGSNIALWWTAAVNVKSSHSSIETEKQIH